MKTNIIILWIFLALGWIVHHLYGVMNIYYTETLAAEGATGEVPLDHHLYRVLFEGFCLLFALLTIEVSKHWFKVASLVWAVLSGLYNIYHLVLSLIYEGSNISEIFILVLVTVASVFLVLNIRRWI
ncbi:hypothetical protein [Sinomicrobium soli]|uniref:hypothetical protein n=1 Tax=Sinomicrobium sp. N-1-3-6 TaxID=2219864 RepID=UPI000DCD8289|nr:hypothetical protein [Sinomicrobium sp. N-1-3-6]RAV29155.1 hypothetical protein DN748_09545 [Sinomicrobium sp. N-1-3-6]